MLESHKLIAGARSVVARTRARLPSSVSSRASARRYALDLTQLKQRIVRSAHLRFEEQGNSEERQNNSEQLDKPKSK